MADNFYLGYGHPYVIHAANLAQAAQQQAQQQQQQQQVRASSPVNLHHVRAASPPRHHQPQVRNASPPHHLQPQQRNEVVATKTDALAQAAQLELGTNPNALAIRRPFDPTAHDLEANFRLTRFADLK